MKLDLSRFWSLFGIPDPVEEFRFDPNRRWRFDFAWPHYRIAVEVEGGIWMGGRHNRPVGYAKDLEKYNKAAKDGWRVFRFTPQQFKNGEAGEFLEPIFTTDLQEAFKTWHAN
jgi:very-short-patch-repair endonuclease